MIASLERDSRRTPPIRRYLFLSDVLAFLIVAGALLAGGRPAPALGLAFALALWIPLAALRGLYPRYPRLACGLAAEEIPAIAVTALLLIGLASLARASVYPDLQHFELAVVPVTALLIVLRAAARALWRRWTPRRRAFVVGEGPLVAVLRRKMELLPELHLAYQRTVSPSELAALLRHAERPAAGDQILVAGIGLDYREVDRLLEYCARNDVELAVVPDEGRFLRGSARLSRLAELPIVPFSFDTRGPLHRFGKRVLDIAVSAFALVVALPLMAAIALAILLEDGRPIFYRQKRAGQNGKVFEMIKFRSMYRDAESRLHEVVGDLAALDEPVFKLENDPRTTRVGRFLRSSSLDELPQLYNVLRGEMSIVGPRPEQVELVERYSEEEKRIRLGAKPGLTGPFQVYGRSKLDWRERLAVERAYVDRPDLASDLRIILLTPSVVLRRDGAF